MPFQDGAYKLYDYLYSSSQVSRYNGFVNTQGGFTDQATFDAIMAKEHEMCEQALEKFKLYLHQKQHLAAA